MHVQHRMCVLQYAQYVALAGKNVPPIGAAVLPLSTASVRVRCGQKRGAAAHEVPHSRIPSPMASPPGSSADRHARGVAPVRRRRSPRRSPRGHPEAHGLGRELRAPAGGPQCRSNVDPQNTPEHPRTFPRTQFWGVQRTNLSRGKQGQPRDIIAHAAPQRRPRFSDADLLI